LEPVKTKYFIVVLLPFLITSCTKDVNNLKLPDFEQKLVLSSFISPDLPVIELTLDCNTNNFGMLFSPEPPGKVTILLTNGTDEVRIDTTLLKSIHNKILVKNMPVKEGKSFKIKVINDKGLSAEASCTVPVKRAFHIEVDTTRLLTHYPFGRNTSSTLSIKVSITDFPGESNYYRLLITGKSYGDPWSSEIFGQYDIGDLVFSDKGNDGKKFVLRSVTFSSNDIDSIAKVDSSFLRIYLLNTDKPYYDFHQSLLTSLNSGGGDPFSEPAPLYSNVSNGVGVLASYTVDSLIFRVK
jgi:hypothetical protein